MDDLRKLAEAATPGPWQIGGGDLTPGNEAHVIRGPHGEYVARCAGNNWRADVPYIAACSPDRILRLLDVVDKAKALLPGLGFYVDPRVTALSTALDALEKDQ